MKKLISVVLALAMVLSLAAGVFAAGNYIVAGSKSLCGTEWNPGDTNNAMTLVDGLYTITYTDVEIGTYEFKVTDGSWANSWGDGSGNYKFAVTTKGDITITFNADTKEIGVSGTGVGEAKMEINFVAAVGAGAGGFLNDVNWDPANTSNKMTEADGVYTITYENVAAGTYSYKFAANGEWVDDWGTGATTESGVTYDAPYKGGDSKLVVAEDGSAVTLVLDLSAMDSKGNGAKITATVTAPSAGGEEGGDAAGVVIAEGTLDYAESSWLGELNYYTATADGTITVEISACDPGYCVSVFNITAEELVEEFKNSTPETVSFNVVAGNEYEIAVNVYTYYGPNLAFASAGTLTYKITADAAGEGGGDVVEEIKSEAPDTLIIGSNDFVIGVNDTNPVVSTYTATQAGTLTITASAMSGYDGIDWVQVNPGMQFGMMYMLNVNGEVVYSPVATVDVAVGDEVVIGVQSAMGSAAKVTLDLTFDATPDEGGEGGEEDNDNIVYGDGNISVTDEPSTDAKPWTYIFNTDTTGILSVTVPQGCRYKIYGLEGEGSESIYFGWYSASEYAIAYTGEIKVCVWAGDSLGNVDGTISAEITFTPDDVEIEIPKEDYVISDTEVFVGENSLTLEENAITTIYAFAPTENGVYTITVSDPAALVGYWGAYSHFVMDYTENKTNVLVYTMDEGEWKLIEPMDEYGNVIEDEVYEEWVCPNIMIGVSGVEGEFTLTIEKTGDAEKEEEIEYNEYFNVHVPTDDNLVDTTGQQVNNVDITKPQTVVKDENGFYHLGSVDGPMLYVNLISDGFDITGPYFSGMGAITLRGQYIDADGDVYYYDFLTAMRAYANVAYMCENEDVLYPLTDDLMIFWKGYGEYQGWYNPNMSSYEAIDGTQNEDSAWLVSCVYLGEEIVDEPENPETPEDPEVTPGTGDYSIAGLVVAMMAATAGAVVIGKKKEF